MKKIDIQNSLRERVKSTEWTDRDTWNVLDRIRATGKTREKHRLTFLVPAAAMLILAVCIGVTSIVNPGTPDLIRPTVQTIQPLALSHSGESASAGNGETAEVDFLSGEEEALSILRESCPEIPEELKPVGVEYEEQGIRVEIVSALVRDHSSWILWTLQDLEGERINESSADYFYDPNNIGEAEEYGYYYKHYDADEKKLTVLEEIRYSSMNEPEDGMYSFSLIDLYTYEHETVDLKPLLEKYFSDIEGVSPPENTRPYYGVTGDPVPQDLKALDYESPANIPLTGKGKLLLTGIGWVGGKLHVQIHEADRAFCDTDEDGISLIRNNSVYITNQSADGNDFESPAGSPYAWEDPANPWDEWLEFVFESTRSDQETMTLTADLFFCRKTVKGSWTFGIPVSMIRDGGDPAESGTVVPPVVDEAGSFFLGSMFVESPDNLTRVGFSHEKDGIRTTVHSALVKGQEASVLMFFRDLEGDRINIDTNIRAEFADGTESGWEYIGRTTTEYDTENHIYAQLIKFSTEGSSDPGEHTATLTFGDLNFYKRTQADLVPLVKQYAPADGEGIAEVDIPLHETVSLTGIGWTEGQLFMKFRGTTHEFPMMTCTVQAADSDGDPVDENRMLQRVALPGDDSSSTNYETTMNISPDEIDRMKLTIDFRNPTGTVEDSWGIQFPVKPVPGNETGTKAEEPVPADN